MPMPQGGSRGEASAPEAARSDGSSWRLRLLGRRWWGWLQVVFRWPGLTTLALRLPLARRRRRRLRVNSMTSDRTASRLTGEGADGGRRGLARGRLRGGGGGGAGVPVRNPRRTGLAATRGAGRGHYPCGEASVTACGRICSRGFGRGLCGSSRPVDQAACREDPGRWPNPIAPARSASSQIPATRAARRPTIFRTRTRRP